MAMTSPAPNVAMCIDRHALVIVARTQRGHTIISRWDDQTRLTYALVSRDVRLTQELSSLLPKATQSLSIAYRSDLVF